MCYPSVFEESTPTARIEHVCCECKRIITVNEVYSLTKGLWDGSWDSFKTCKACHYLRYEAIHQAELHDYAYDEMPQYCDLHDWIYEFKADTGVDINART